MSAPPPTAAARVFSIAELLEQILLYLAEDASSRRSYLLDPFITLSRLRLIDHTCNNAVLHAIKRHNLYPHTIASVKWLLYKNLGLSVRRPHVDMGFMNRTSINKVDLRSDSQDMEAIETFCSNKKASWRLIPLLPPGSDVSKLKVQFSNVRYGAGKQGQVYYDEAIFRTGDELGHLADVLVEMAGRSEEEHEEARERMFANKKAKQERHLRTKNGL